jgi:hypothetical protein
MCSSKYFLARESNILKALFKSTFFLLPILQILGLESFSHCRLKLMYPEKATKFFINHPRIVDAIFTDEYSGLLTKSQLQKKFRNIVPLLLM